MKLDEQVRALVADEVGRITGQTGLQVAGVRSPAAMRCAANLSAEELAERAGVSTSTIHRLEQGKFRRDIYKTVWRVAKALGVEERLYEEAVFQQRDRRLA